MLSTRVRRPLSRIAVLAAGAVAATALAVAAPATASAADATAESQFVAKMNSARQANGLRPYAVYSDLVAVARRQAARMQQRGAIYHNPNLGTEVSNWQAVGENVGVGGSVSDIHNAFMNSPSHRANILDHDFTQVGVGVVVGSDGRMWVAEVFRQPYGTTSAAPAPAPAPRTVSKPSVPSTVVTRRSSAPTAKPVAAPSAGEVARQRLASRLQTMKAHRPATGDPLALALVYSNTLAQLTR